MPGLPLPDPTGQGAPGHHAVPAGTGSDRAIVAAAATLWGISAKTLWGVYGTESTFSHNPGTSSAGAEGPFQFIPSTARRYGVNVHDFQSSAYGAAHYLHDLGADGNPTSAATRKALNDYNGNGSGPAESSYTRSVESKGESFSNVNLPDVPNPITAAEHALSPLAALGKVAAALVNPNTYFRLGKGALGGTLLIVGTAGLVFVVANKASGGQLGQTAKKAAVLAAAE